MDLVRGARAATFATSTDGPTRIEIESFKELSNAIKRFVIKIHPDIMHQHGQEAVATNEAALQELFLCLDTIRARHEQPDASIKTAVSAAGREALKASYNVQFNVKDSDAASGLRRVAVALRTPPLMQERMTMLAQRGMQSVASARYLQLGTRLVQQLLDSVDVPIRLSLHSKVLSMLGSKAGAADQDENEGEEKSDDSAFDVSASQDPEALAKQRLKELKRKAKEKERAMTNAAESAMDSHLRQVSPLTQGKAEQDMDSLADAYYNRSRWEAANWFTGGVEGSSRRARTSDDSSSSSSSSSFGASAAMAAAGISNNPAKMGRKAKAKAKAEAQDLMSRASAAQALGLSDLAAELNARAHGARASAEATEYGEEAAFGENEEAESPLTSPLPTTSVFPLKVRKARVLRILSRADSVLEPDTTAAAAAASPSRDTHAKNAGIDGSDNFGQPLTSEQVRLAVARLIRVLTDHHDALQLYEDAWLTVKFALKPPGSEYYSDAMNRTLHLPVDFHPHSLAAYIQSRFAPALISAARGQVKSAADRERKRMAMEAKQKRYGKAPAPSSPSSASAGGGKSASSAKTSGVGAGVGVGKQEVDDESSDDDEAEADDKEPRLKRDADGMLDRREIRLQSKTSKKAPAGVKATDAAAGSLDEVLLRSWATPAHEQYR